MGFHLIINFVHISPRAVENNNRYTWSMLQDVLCICGYRFNYLAAIYNSAVSLIFITTIIIISIKVNYEYVTTYSLPEFYTNGAFSERTQRMAVLS